MAQSKISLRWDDERKDDGESRELPGMPSPLTAAVLPAAPAAELGVSAAVIRLARDPVAVAIQRGAVSGLPRIDGRGTGGAGGIASGVIDIAWRATAGRSIKRGGARGAAGRAVKRCGRAR